jgi:site-specific recombinase XerD
LDNIVDQGKGREAEKRRQVSTAMFRWALSQDIVAADPSVGLEAYDRGTPRDRVLTVEEIETLWRWLRARIAIVLAPTSGSRTIFIRHLQSSRSA